MTMKYGFNYRGFRLHCDPMPMTDGQFGAQAIIASDDEESHIDRPFTSLGCFKTEQEAVDFAIAWGERWVDEFIGVV